MLIQATLMAVTLMPAASPKAMHAKGCLPMTAKQVATLQSKGLDFGRFRKGIKATLPPKYELKWMPRPHPVGQGMRGSCVGWAFAYAAKSCMEANESQRFADGPERFFSPTFLYSQRMDKSEEGMSPAVALNILYRLGCARYSDMPYQEATADNPPTIEQQQAAYPFQIADWIVMTPTSENLRIALSQDMPVVLITTVTSEFEELDGERVFDDFQPDHATGRHAMCAVGYDDQRRAIRLVNSWGIDWGDHGYGWVGYDVFDTDADAENRFCAVGIGVIDAPNLTTDVTISSGPSGTYRWMISVMGGPAAVEQLEYVDYLLPAGYEPSVVRRTAGDGDGGAADRFRLRSSDVQPSASSAPLEVWVQFGLKGLDYSMSPRPVLISRDTAAGTPPPIVTRTAPWRRSAAGAAEPSAEQVTVPNVVGTDSGVATLKLIALGFQVKVRHDSQAAGASTARQGTVVKQSPVAGSKAAKGADVILTTP